MRIYVSILRLDRLSEEADELKLPRFRRGSVNGEEACGSAIEDPDEVENHRLLKPLKVRLRTLLKSVQEETESFATIRQKFKERECERSSLKSRSRMARIADQHLQPIDHCGV